MLDGTDLGTEGTKTGAGHYLKLLYLIQYMFAQSP